MSLNCPAGNGRLHFAGEALSARHAWVEGALDSAWRAVAELLWAGGESKEAKELQEKFVKNWGVNQEWIDPHKAKSNDPMELFDKDSSLLIRLAFASSVARGG